MITLELILTMALNASLFVVVLVLCLRERRRDLEHARRMLWINRHLQKGLAGVPGFDPAAPPAKGSRG
jgi:hypothetical protein